MKLSRYNIISGNAKVVRSVNRAVILNIIREMQPISRVKIAKLTGLNKSTVSSIVSGLLEEGIIYEQVDEDRNVGRNPINLHLKLGEFFVGAINIDSTITRFAVSDIDGSLIETSSINTEAENPAKFIEQCVHELFKLRDNLKIQHFEGLGVSIAGIVDPGNLLVNFAPNLGWEDFNVGKEIRRLCPNEGIISIGNDAKSSALAELWFGKHDLDISNFVFLSIGPGIGAGIVVENKLVNGGFQASGEFGHMTIFEGGELCSCGNYGCWEAYASDRATVKRYNVKSQRGNGRTVDIVLQDIIDLARENEEEAIKILGQTGHYLGLGIANIIKAIDPEAIIIGGRIIQAWDIIYPEIMQTVMRRAFFGKKRDVKIVPTSLKARPRLLGAATLAIIELFSDFKITR